jgi:hypothetical protein
MKNILRRGSSKGRRPTDRAVSQDRRWARHELYGDVLLIRQSLVGRDGRPHEWWQYDPNYVPTLPRGAVAGDVMKQVLCASCHVPKYFYVDETRRCAQCGERFTFSGKEQKYWYEVSPLPRIRPAFGSAGSRSCHGVFFALLPVFAGLVALFYRKRHFPTALVFAVHLHAFGFVVFAISESLKFTANEHLADRVGAILAIVFAVYALKAFRAVYGADGR